MSLSREGGAYAHLRMIRNRWIHWRKGLRAAHPTSYVHSSCLVAKDAELREYVFLGRSCQLDPGVRVGRYTMLASRVAIVGDDHVWTLPGVPMQFSGRPPQSVTEIGADVWIGFGALIRRGVTIGEGAIVAAHAVVTSDVAPYAVVAGVPARKIRDRFDSGEERARHAAALSGPLIQPRFAQPLRDS